jgi:hypothetical protein
MALRRSHVSRALPVATLGILLLLTLAPEATSAGLRRHVCTVGNVEWQFGEQDAWRRTESIAADGYRVLSYKNAHLVGYSFIARVKGTSVDRLVLIGTTRGGEKDHLYLATMMSIASVLAWGEDDAPTNLSKLIQLSTAALTSPGSGKERTIGRLKASAGATRASDGMAFMLDLSGSAHP